MKTKLSVFCEKIIEAGWLVVVVVIPLFFNIYSARTFEPDKITLMRSITAVMILAWIIMLVEQGFSNDGLSFRQRVKNWFKIPLFGPTAALAMVYLLSTAMSISPQVSLWGSYQRLQGAYSALSYMVVFALMAGQIRTRDQVDRFVTIVIITSVPVSLYGIIQRYGLDPLPWAGDVTSRVASNMGNAIFVASYLIMIVPLTISRLIESMAAIIKEESASWGHTILAAVYIFVLSVQVLTIIFSGSRGPMLGVLAAAFLMGVVFLLVLRRNQLTEAGLSPKEVGQGLGFALPLGLAGGLGLGLGFAVGAIIETALSSMGYQVDNVKLLGAAVGGMLGFLGLLTYMAAAHKGWRWLWLSWLGVAIVGTVVMVLLNVPGTPLDPYLDPIRRLPYLDRLADIRSDSTTARVRTYIWDASMGLIAPHEPLGVVEDPESPPDSLNAFRPLIGYGPESMFNAFAYVYPPGLAYVENRGSSADRSHNETMDSLVITGVLGFLAFYTLMISILYYALRWLGWVPNAAARYRYLGLVVASGFIGAMIPWLAEGKFTFMPVGLPFGLVAGVLLYLVWQGLFQTTGHSAESLTPIQTKLNTEYTLLVIGLFGAIIGHFIEVHFVFSIAATYTYFWAYAGLLVALCQMKFVLAAEIPAEPAGEPEPEDAALPAEAASARPGKKSLNRKSPRRPLSEAASPAAVSASVDLGYSRRESWEVWLASQGLIMAIIMIIMAFDFITPQFEFTLTNSKTSSFFWLVSITWLVGLAIALSKLAILKEEWRGAIHWGKAAFLYVLTSLSYFFFYTIAHRIQFGQRITVASLDDVLKAASVLTNGLILFYIFTLLLMAIIALVLSWGQLKRLKFWQGDIVNTLLYPVLVLAFTALIWFKNVDVVRADIYLKEGERYRGNRQWNEALALHERSRSLDSDEDFYYLMLALDYQLMAQDGNLSPEIRSNAWAQGEQIALEARRINPYNPDNTGNMGRYYFTLGQVTDPNQFNQALDFFRKATILAPSNVIYHNLWAQTFYIQQNYDQAIDRLQTSIAIDGRYPPSWILLGDTYAAKGDVAKALPAHTQAMKIGGWNDFADQFLEQRLNFYISAGRGEDIIAAVQQLALDNPTDPKMQWVIGTAYNLMGQPAEAARYFEQAGALGDTSDQTVRSLANLYLTTQKYDQAIPAYQQLLKNNPNNVEAHSALAYIYAQQGRLDDAIQHNLQVLQSSPTDYDTLKNLAIIYQQQQKWPEALDMAQKAQTSAPEAEKVSWDAFIAGLQGNISTQPQ